MRTLLLDGPTRPARSRSGPARWRTVIVALVLALVAGAGEARAQGSSNSTFTSSTSRTQTITTQTVQQQIATAITQIIGRLANQTSVYDQTFNAAFNDPQVQAGIAQARAAILRAGGATAMTGPTLTSRSQTTTTTSRTADSSTASTMISSGLFFGPQTILIGARGLCTFGGAVGQLPSGCETGTPFLVRQNTTDVNTNTNTDTQIQRTTTITDDVQTMESYEIVGAAATTVPEPGTLALLGGGLAGAGLLVRRRRR